jgi:hypothetical protein
MYKFAPAPLALPTAKQVTPEHRRLPGPEHTVGIKDTIDAQLTPSSSEYTISIAPAPVGLIITSHRDPTVANPQIVPATADVGAVGLFVQVTPVGLERMKGVVLNLPAYDETSAISITPDVESTAALEGALGVDGGVESTFPR